MTNNPEERAAIQSAIRVFDTRAALSHDEQRAMIRAAHEFRRVHGDAVAPPDNAAGFNERDVPLPTTIGSGLHLNLSEPLLRLSFELGATVTNDCEDPSRNSLRYALDHNKDVRIVSLLLEYGARLVDEPGRWNSIGTVVSLCYVRATQVVPNTKLDPVATIQVLLDAGADASNVCVVPQVYNVAYPLLLPFLARYGATYDKQWFHRAHLLGWIRDATLEEAAAPFQEYTTTASEAIACHLPTTRSGAPLTELCMEYLGR
jgi:hypothetical protein